jgi:Tfp pilus assembly protein PilE
MPPARSRFTFTVRRLMIAVAVVAVLLAAVDAWRMALRQRHYESLARAYRSMATFEEALVSVAVQTGSDPEKHVRRAARYAGLGRKYEQAAARPWAAVGPDPPLPR